MRAFTKLPHTSRSIALSSPFDSSISEISFIILSKHRCRGLSLLGFLTTIFRMKFSPPRKTRPAYSLFVLPSRIIWCLTAYYITFPDCRFFVFYILKFNFEQVRGFFLWLSFRRWVISLRLSVLWTMSHMSTLLWNVNRRYTVFLSYSWIVVA